MRSFCLIGFEIFGRLVGVDVGFWGVVGFWLWFLFRGERVYFGFYVYFGG